MTTEIQSLTRADAVSMGLDISMVSICKKIRRYAKLDRLQLDESLHRSELNRHLFSYMEYCGCGVLEFIKGYLANLQPYMIVRRQEQEKSEHFICVIDELYFVSVYIKLDTTEHEEIVVSFHEDNRRGIARRNSVRRNEQRLVPVFAENITAKVEGENNYVVRCLVQRGMKVLPVEIAAKKCEDFFIVNKNEIDTVFIRYCNDYLQDVYTSDLNLDFSDIEVFSYLQQVSFTSYGRDTFSSISLLIDSLIIQPDTVSRRAADFALVTYAQSLRLTEEEMEELTAMLTERYRVRAVKEMDLILERVTDSLSLGVVE